MNRNRRTAIFRAATKTALTTRLKLGYALDKPVCPFGVAQELGIEVRFANISSLEGIYHRSDPPSIIVSSGRPAGRKALTCAHELGHHTLGHSTGLDEEILSSTATSNPEIELAADAFASFLLLPRPLAERLLTHFEYLKDLDSIILAASAVAGMSYDAYVVHATLNLSLLDRNIMEQLRKQNVASIKEKLLGQRISCGRVLVIDGIQPVILAETGDILITDFRNPTSRSSYLVEPIELGRSQGFICRHSGICTLESGSVDAVQVKIRKATFEGRAEFQYLEDPDDYE